MSTGATPNWKQLNLLNNSFFKTIRKELVATRQDLNVINQILDTIQSAVSTVSELVALIRVFEMMIHRTLYAILDAIIKVIREFLNSVKSTGIYVLDLTTYHFTPTPVVAPRQQSIPDRWWDSQILRDEMSSSNIKNPSLEPLRNVLNSLNALSTTQRDASVIAMIDKIERYLQGEAIAFSIIELIQLANNISDPGLMAKVKRLFTAFNYKTETYNEFINVICDSLLDPDDVVDPMLQVKALRTFTTSIGEQSGGGNPPASRPLISKDVTNISAWKPEFNHFDGLFRSGAPRFGKNSYMKTIIVGASFDDFSKLMELYDVIQRVFKNGAFTTAWNDVINTKGFSSTLNVSSLTDTLPHFLTDFQMAPTSYRASRHEPNFMGLTLNQLAGDLFNVFERMLNYLQALSLSDKLYIDTIADSIQFVVDKIKNGIGKIKQIIQFIEDIIYLIESMMALAQFYMLNVTTQDGVSDTVYQIKNAEQFIPMKVKDKDICARFKLPYDADTAVFLNQNRESQTDILDNIAAYQIHATEMISEKSAQAQVEQAKLTTLQQHRTAYYTINLNLKNFEIALAASTYSADLAAFEAWILAQQDYIALLETQYQALLATDGNRAWLANQITSYTATQTNYDVMYTQQIAAIQAQIDALNPGMIDYATQLVALTAQKNTLQTNKTNTHNYYQDLIDRFTATKNNVDAFLVFPINTYADLIPITNKINALQASIDALVTAYNLYISAYNLARAGKLSDISTKQGQIATNNSTIVTKQNQIADKTAQLNYLLIVDPGNPQIPILQADIAQLNLDISNLQAANVTLANDITTLYSDIATLDANKTTYENGKIKDEENLYREKNCYVAWKSSETKRLDKNVASSGFTGDYATKKAALETEVNSLVATKIPTFADPAYATYVTELVQTQELKTSYQFVSYTIANHTVFPKIYIPESRCTTNMLIKYDGEIVDQSGTKKGGQIQTQQNKVNSLQSEAAYYTNQIANMPSQQAMPAEIESAKDWINTSQYFDKDQKMYFAGFLVSFGYPLNPASNSTDSLKSNFSEIVNSGIGTIKQSSIGMASEVRSSDSISQVGKKIESLIKKLGFK